MRSYTPNNAIHAIHNVSLSATASLQMYPKGLGDKKPPNYLLTDPNRASNILFERAVKRIVRKELRNFSRGVGRMLDQNETSNFKKAFWLCATITCLSIASYFLFFQITEYCDRKTILQSNLQQTAIIKIPSLTICPGTPVLSREKVKKFLKEKCADYNSVTNCEKTSFKVLGTSIMNIWELEEIARNTIFITVQCQANELQSETSCAVPNLVSEFYSFWGKCIILKPKDNRHFFQGPHNYYNITVGDSGHYEGDILQIYLHSGTHIHNHMSYFKSYQVKRNDYISISMEQKEIHMLNKNLDKCTDTKEDLNCEEHCLDQLLKKHVKCRLPFMKCPDHPYCDTFQEANQAMQDANQFYREINKLNCSRCGDRCEQVMYNMGINNIGPTKENNTQLLFYYQNNILETVEQARQYPFAKFLSDVGGVLGFFLGFSVLGTLELFQQFIYCSKKRYVKFKCANST